MVQETEKRSATQNTPETRSKAASAMTPTEDGNNSEDASNSGGNPLKRKRGRPRKSDIQAKEAAAAAKAALKALNIEEEAVTFDVEPPTTSQEILSDILKNLKKVFERHPGSEMVLDMDVAKLEMDDETFAEASGDKNESRAGAQDINLGSIAEKMGSGKGFDSLPSLEDDILYACRHFAETLSPHDPLSSEITAFWDFASSLIRRYGLKYGAYLEGQKLQSKEHTIADIAPPPRSKEREALVLIGANGPLFSSLSSRSKLDNAILDTAGVAQFSKIIPTQSTAWAGSLNEADNVGSNASVKAVSEVHSKSAKSLVDKSLSPPERLQPSNHNMAEPTNREYEAQISAADLALVQGYKKDGKAVEKLRKLESAGPEIDEDLIMSYNPEVEYRGTLEQRKLSENIFRLQQLQRERILSDSFRNPSSEELELAHEIEKQILDIIEKNQVLPKHILDPSEPVPLTLPFREASFSGSLPSGGASGQVGVTRTNSEYGNSGTQTPGRSFTPFPRFPGTRMQSPMESVQNANSITPGLSAGLRRLNSPGPSSYPSPSEFGQGSAVRPRVAPSSTKTRREGRGWW